MFPDEYSVKFSTQTSVPSLHPCVIVQQKTVSLSLSLSLSLKLNEAQKVNGDREMKCGILLRQQLAVVVSTIGTYVRTHVHTCSFDHVRTSPWMHACMDAGRQAKKHEKKKHTSDGRTDCRFPLALSTIILK